MRKFKGQLAAACFAVVTAATGSALAQSPDDPNATSPNPANPATTPSTTDVTPPPPAPPPAEPAPVVVPPPQQTYNTTYNNYASSGSESRMDRVGFSLSAGGGVADFTDKDMRDTTGVEGTWAVRATLGTKTPLGFEGSYIGSAQSINALGLDNDAVLVSNGLQGALRLNAVIGAPITPFIFGGVAWSRFNVTNTNQNLSAISDKDDLLEIPVGLGVGGSWRGFGYDVRGELRFATEEDLVPEISAGRDTGSHADMHRWGVNATIGYGF
jgi:hypothetical protein